MNQLQRITEHIFDRLQNGQIRISDLSTSELKRYKTALALYKKAELHHFQIVSREVQQRSRLQSLGVLHYARSSFFAQKQGNTFRMKTLATFDKLHSGQLTTSAMTNSQLRSYLTGVAFFKKNQGAHYRLLQRQFRMRVMPETLEIKPKKRKSLLEQKKKVAPKTNSTSLRTSSQVEKPHFGAIIKKWFVNTFTTFFSQSDQQTELLKIE